MLEEETKKFTKVRTGGESWSASTAGQSNITDISSLVIDPQTNSKIYAGTMGEGFLIGQPVANSLKLFLPLIQRP